VIIFKNAYHWDVLTWVISQVHAKVIIEVEKVIKVDSQVVLVFVGVLYELLSKSVKSR
jgi:hypothetical protein